MYIFAIAVFLVLLLPRLWSFGMFLDGLLYAGIARNMAEGAGSFNAPYYADALGPVFYWHPPLAIWLHSLFYRVFGDHTLVDSLFGFVSGSVICGLLYLIFREADPQKTNERKPYWSIVFLVSLMPMTSWIFSNNMLEVTMTMFALASVYVQLRGLNFKSGMLAAHYILAGGFLALAILSKNIAGTFPLIFLFLNFILLRNISFKKMLILGFALTASMIMFTYFILYFSNSIEFYRQYLRMQLIPAVSGQMAGGTNPFLGNTWLIIGEMLTPILVSILLTTILRKWKEIKINKISILFMIMGLSGILPLFLITKFRTYYIYPGLPFLVLSIALAFSPAFAAIEQRVKDILRFRRVVQGLSILMIAAAIVLFVAGKDYPARLKEFKYDVYDSGLHIPARAVIASCSPDSMNDYTLVAAFQRYYKLSLMYVGDLSTAKWIFQDQRLGCSLPSRCVKVNRADASRYNIYECPQAVSQK